MLRRHGRYVYSPITERPVYDWPDGKRLAIYVALNIEDTKRDYVRNVRKFAAFLGRSPDTATIRFSIA
jgi:hypothetical protein